MHWGFICRHGSRDENVGRRCVWVRVRISRTDTHLEDWDLGHIRDGYCEGYCYSLLAEADSIAVKAKHRRTKGEKRKSSDLIFSSFDVFFFFFFSF